MALYLYIICGASLVGARAYVIECREAIGTATASDNASTTAIESVMGIAIVRICTLAQICLHSGCIYNKTHVPPICFKHVWTIHFLATRFVLALQQHLVVVKCCGSPAIGVTQKAARIQQS